jgi:hypothetical protein
MRNLFFLLIICFFSSNTCLQAHEEDADRNLEEILCSCSKAIEAKEGKIHFNPDRTWIFNDQIYLLNDSEQWVFLGSRPPSDVDELVAFHAKAKKCFKWHDGVFLDKTYFADGLWYCRGLMHDGSLCPYHMVRQFPPDGIAPEKKK